MITLQVTVRSDSANSHPNWELGIGLFGTEHGDFVQFKLESPEREITVSRKDMEAVVKLLR